MQSKIAAKCSKIDLMNEAEEVDFQMQKEEPDNNVKILTDRFSKTQSTQIA